MIRKLVWIGTIIGIYFLIGVLIEGCSKPKPVTATAPAIQCGASNGAIGDSIIQ